MDIKKLDEEFFADRTENINNSWRPEWLIRAEDALPVASLIVGGGVAAASLAATDYGVTTILLGSIGSAIVTTLATSAIYVEYVRPRLAKYFYRDLLRSVRGEVCLKH